jgi:Phosphate-selective porin O and P
VAARTDYIDLNNEGVKGGEQISYIAGVNWYANDYVRFMLDGAVTQVFNARDTDAAVTGSQNLIYGGGSAPRLTGSAHFASEPAGFLFFLAPTA